MNNKEFSKMKRRNFIRGVGGIMFGVGSGLLSYARVETYLRKKTYYTLSSDLLPPNTRSLKFIIASDFHFGSPGMQTRSAKSVVKSINAENPDFILMPGDFSNEEDEIDKATANGYVMPPEQFGEILGGLKAKYGILASLGNHDWYDDGHKIRCALEDNGVTVLENEATTIHVKNQTLQFVGIGDYGTGHSDIKEAFSRANPSLPTITLHHNPLTHLETQEHSLRSVFSVAGHTHGGQVNIPFYGPPRMPHSKSLAEEYTYGHLQTLDSQGREQNMFVTSGLGTSGVGVRFNVLPEIAVITLTPAPAI